MDIYVHQYTLTSALGAGLDATRQSLVNKQTGLSNLAWQNCDVPCYLGRVTIPDALEIATDRLSRNNLLIEYALQQDNFVESTRAIIQQLDPGRCGLVIGTSTSSIDCTETAYAELDENNRFAEEYRNPKTHNPHAPGDYLASRLGIDGPQITISAACASSAKVYATAKRWLEQNLVDAVVVGGADSLCLSVIYGFHSLQLVSPQACQPFDVDRQGISLGEAAGFALLTRDSSNISKIKVMGVGESCDAYHMSSAHPEGLGAKLSMQRAIDDASISIHDIDYVNLHGTGTRANDETEGMICGKLFQANTIASATKGWTGHTLGAAGIVESILCFEALTSGLIPGTLNTKNIEASFEILLQNEQREINTALTNSFGFGGNNCSVIFGKT